MRQPGPAGRTLSRACTSRPPQSADPKIREWATYTVASRCIARGDLDRAEALLDQISNTHRDKRELLSALRRKQGRTEEAWTLLERELFDRAHGIQTTLLSLIEMAQAEGTGSEPRAFATPPGGRERPWT